MSSVTKLDLTSDLTFNEYNKWQQKAVSFDNLRNQSLQLKAADKYVFNGKEWSIPDYEGFAVISAVNANPGNDKFFNQLIHLKEDLKFRLNNSTSYYWLPENSYHQTIANTLSNERYHKNIKDKGLVQEYPGIIEMAFKSLSVSANPSPISLKMLGYNVFGSCIALLGIFENSTDYERIITFRNQFYGNPELNKLGIKFTRPFIGHVTFAYLGQELTPQEGEHLAHTLSSMNKGIENMKMIFNITQAELRYFKNLSHFQKEPDFPTFSFISD